MGSVRVLEGKPRIPLRFCRTNPHAGWDANPPPSSSQNTTGVTGETAWCTSTTSGWAYNFVQNATSGVVDFVRWTAERAKLGLEWPRS